MKLIIIMITFLKEFECNDEELSSNLLIQVFGIVTMLVYGVIATIIKQIFTVRPEPITGRQQWLNSFVKVCTSFCFSL